MTPHTVNVEQQAEEPALRLSVPRVVESKSGWVGLLLGSAAATGGLLPVIGPIRPWHIFLLLAVAVAISGPARKIKPHAVEWALLTYVAVRCVVELINSNMLHYSMNWNALIYPVWWWFAFIAAKRVIRDAAQAVAMLRGICVPFLFSVPVAVGQTLGIDPILDFTEQHVESHGFQSRVLVESALRGVGLVGHWTHWGVYCSALLTVALTLLLLARRQKIGGAGFPVLVIFAGVVGLASSITFAPMAIAAIVAVIALRRIGFSVPTMVALAAGALGAATFLGSNLQERAEFQSIGTSRVSWLPDWVPSTIGYRVYIWTSETIPMISDRIVTGWGINVYEGAHFATHNAGRTYPSQLQWVSAESQWFHELMSTGALGFAALLTMLLSIFSLLLRIRDHLLVDLVVPLRAFVIALVLAASTAPMLTNKGAPLILWPMLGAVVGLRALYGDGTPPRSSVRSRRFRY